MAFISYPARAVVEQTHEMFGEDLATLAFAALERECGEEVGAHLAHGPHLVLEELAEVRQLFARITNHLQIIQK